MTDTNDYTTSFTVDKTPEEVYAAILNTRGWWSGNIEGKTDEEGAEFTYEVPDVHWSKQKIVQLVPGKKVVWKVLDSKITYTTPQNVWDNLDMIFDITENDGKTELRFTQKGMVPSLACYGDITSAWDSLIPGNLKKLVETGENQPSPW